MAGNVRRAEKGKTWGLEEGGSKIRYCRVECSLIENIEGSQKLLCR